MDTSLITLGLLRVASHQQKKQVRQGWWDAYRINKPQLLQMAH